MSVELLGFEIAVPVLFLGAITGMVYGILAVGLVLVYRSNRIVNFAHGEVGTFAAAVFGVAVVTWHVPYWLMFPVALALGAAVSMLAEVVVIRRLRAAPRLMSVVATLGVAQFLQVLSLVVNVQAGAGSQFPLPSLLPEFGVGALRVTRAYSGLLLLTPPVVLAIGSFLRRHRVGKAMRGAAANPEAARMAGISPGRMSSIAWGISGAVAAFTAILFLPTQGFVALSAFGPSLLMRALAAAVLARMQSLPVALAAGLGLGMVEQLLLSNNPRGGLLEPALLAIIVVSLLLQRRRGTGREQERGAWAAVLPWQPLPERLLAVRSIRLLPLRAGLVALALAALLPLVVSNLSAAKLTSVIAFAIVGLSVGVMTGLGGQLTLGQFAIAALGATTSFWVSTWTGSVGVGVLAGGLVAGLGSLVIGLPALRIRGLMLTVTTLAFGLVVETWLLRRSWMLGSGGVNPERPAIGGLGFASGKSYYLFALAWLAAAIWLARNIRTGGIGRRLVAVRDNEDAARAFTVRASVVKLQAFVLSGFVAGIGGAVYGHSLSLLNSEAFPLRLSIDVAVMAVLGGIGVLSGPLIGALWVVGVPAFVDLDVAVVAATKLGALALILYAPGGIAQMLRPVRDRVVAWLASRADVAAADEVDAPPSARTSEDRPVARVRRPDGPGAGEVVLAADGLSRSYGGVRAVAGVDLEVRQGEILGLIGPNGAGKTTLFELLGGFTRPDGGTIVLAGADITDWTPERRGKHGLIRSFQDASLFATMTVLDTVRLACERTEPTRLAAGLLGLRGAERRKDAAARELVGEMGLHAYRDTQIRELSTGTRRITELACLMALQPSVLLLDEPASGIAQRETEALGGLLRRIRDDLDLTLVVIEHDIPLIMSLADRIVAMDAGRIIADGDPQTVRHLPAVVESYLGGDLTAIERSGPVAPGA